MEASFVWDELTQTYIFRVTKINWRSEKAKLNLFLDVLKSSIPSGHRDYDPKTYTWYIKESYYDILEPIMENYFDGFHSSKKPDTGTASGNIIPTDEYLKTFRDYCTQAVTDKFEFEFDKIDWHTLSLKDANKIYRWAAMKYHPDRNPQGAEIMSKLNEAWANLKGVYFK